MTTKNKLLLISDIPGYGKVGMSAQIPILSKMGFDLYNLPTALVSNTLDYGKFHIFIPTEHMVETIKVWKELDFRFDAISIAFIGEPSQIPVIEEFVSYHRNLSKDLIVSLDTVMADNGKLYNGIYEDTIISMRKLCGIADYITPNWTEACMIADIPYKKDVSRDEVQNVASKIFESANSKIVITSVPLKDHMTIAIYDGKEIEFIDYSEIPIHMPGTGDIFSAVTIGNVLKGKTLSISAKKASEVVVEMLKKSIDLKDKYHGIPLEQYLGKVELE